MKPLLFEMENKDRQHKMVDMIKKIVSMHKPEMVVDIDVKVEPASSDSREFYYLYLTYIVNKIPNLNLSSANDILKDAADGWSKGIKNTIELFLNTRVYLLKSEIKYSKE